MRKRSSYRKLYNEALLGTNTGNFWIAVRDNGMKYDSAKIQYYDYNHCDFSFVLNSVKIKFYYI